MLCCNGHHLKKLREVARRSNEVGAREGLGRYALVSARQRGAGFRARGRCCGTHSSMGGSARAARPPQTDDEPTQPVGDEYVLRRRAQARGERAAVSK